MASSRCCLTPNHCGWAPQPSYRLRRPHIPPRCTKAGAVAAPNSLPVKVGVNAAKVSDNAGIATVLVNVVRSLTTGLPCAVLPMTPSQEMMIPRALW
jgi:hypothetical protein